MWQVGDVLRFKNCRFTVTVVSRIDEYRFMTDSCYGPSEYSDGPNDPGGFELLVQTPAQAFKEYMELFQ